MTFLTKLDLPRLSVIIPAIPKKAWVERAIESVLSQRDPLGTEIVVACGEAHSSVADHLEGATGADVREVVRRAGVTAN